MPTGFDGIETGLAIDVVEMGRMGGEGVGGRVTGHHQRLPRLRLRERAEQEQPRQQPAKPANSLPHPVSFPFVVPAEAGGPGASLTTLPHPAGRGSAGLDDLSGLD